MTRQYVACAFKPGDTRSYTYHNDGDPLYEGDRVNVDTPRGILTVSVVKVLDRVPTFITKPVIGRIEAAALREPPAPQGSLL